MDEKEKSIGIFDSGIGGLTVLKEVKKLLPHENLVYFGDTARVPYGNKSAETIIRYSLESAFFLSEKNIKLLIIACNTVSACSLKILQHYIKVPIIGVIEPGIKTLLETTRNFKVAILGTRATIASKVHYKMIVERAPQTQIFPLAAPLFVPLVEEGFINNSIAESIVHAYLSHLPKNEIDTILLACTHYPLLTDVIQKEVGQLVKLINPAFTCAEEVYQILLSQNLLASSNKLGHAQYFVSDDAERFKIIGERFLESKIEDLAIAHPASIKHDQKMLSALKELIEKLHSRECSKT
jgi:glutamate racemase